MMMNIKSMNSGLTKCHHNAQLCLPVPSVVFTTQTFQIKIKDEHQLVAM